MGVKKNYTLGIEGSQAVPVRPSGRSIASDEN
jgi:hypothetical protein